MIKMTPEESHLSFLKNCTTANKLFFIKYCTTVNKSADSYRIFDRINETIARLKGLPSFDIYSILEVSELDRIIESLQNDEDFLSYNSKGNNQYTNALAYYRRYLLALQLSQATPSKEERSSVPLSLQIIYFGAPGSGKSHKVAEDLAGVGRENIFRTTFHPDYDYASFVGCYKPEMRSEPIWEESYTLDELLAIIPNEVRVGENYPVEKFCLRHYRSIEKLNISSSQKNELRVKILQAAKNSEEHQAEGKTIQTATVLAGAALGRYLEDNGILSASGNSTAIAYAFTPQVFTNAYVRAWEHPNEKVYLVIEEINRGNCAQIFGDLFQLLDRKDDGTSCYPIRADKDLADYLQHALGGDAKRGIEEGNLCLPPNLHIIATMNTSDQSLFPMDSAFKRRWDWEYIPINYSDEVKSEQFEIVIGKEENQKRYRWIDFLKEINKHILKVTGSEDKQMGNFFIKSSIKEKEFKSKVMAYLWHEVCKDEYGTQSNFFRSGERTGDGEEFSFNQLYDGDINSTKLLHGFMAYLGVSAIGEESAEAKNE
jgi:type II restriction-modification system restriction subunit